MNPYLLGTIAILLWSTVAVAFRLALQKLSVLQVLSLASTTSFFVILVTLAFQNKLSQVRQLKGKDWLQGLILGVGNPFLYYLCLFESYKRLPTQVAQSLNFTWPLFLALGAFLFLGESISLINLVAIFISFLGLLTIIFQDFGPQGELSVIGVLFALSSALIWAGFWIFNSTIKKPPLIKLFLSFLFGTPLILMATIVFDELPNPDFQGLALSIYIGLFEMGISFIIWLKALEKVPRKDVLSNLSYLSPLISLFLIQAFLGESIQMGTILGLVLIVTGNAMPKILVSRMK